MNVKDRYLGSDMIGLPFHLPLFPGQQKTMKKWLTASFAAVAAFSGICAVCNSVGPGSSVGLMYLRSSSVAQSQRLY